MNKIIFYTSLLISFLFISQSILADKNLKININNHQEQFEQVAMKIWDYAEVGYQEYQSSDLLKKELSNEGFVIKENIAGMPTAFTAEYGSGYPVIAILGEFDALPGVAQSASPFKDILFINHKSEFKGFSETFDEFPSSISLSFIKTFT